MCIRNGNEGGFKILQIDKNTLEITEVEPLKKRIGHVSAPEWDICDA
jgi:hypothetical protein